MIAKKRNKGLLKLNDNPMKRMLEYVQDKEHKSEAGGVLMGRFISNSKNVVIDRVTVPMFGDKRRRCSFVRSEKMHQKVITSAWAKSGGTCNYLGEWHTHPEEYPEPSRQDYKNWKEILSTRVFPSQFLYFVIVGINEIRIWEGDRRKQKIRQIL